MIYNKKYKCYVSKEGLVYSVKKGKLVLRSLSRFSKKKKYIRVCVRDYETNKIVSKRVHRLVWETFKGEIPEGMQIDHIDGNPENNRLDNLRCVTPKENSNNPNTIWKIQGKNNRMYGKKHTEKTRKRMSINRNPYWYNKYNMTVSEIQQKLNKCYETIVRYDQLGILKEMI